jgi:hypothetical protein
MVPDRGANMAALINPDGTGFTRIFLAPMPGADSTGLAKKNRRIAERSPIVYASVRADLDRAYLPDDFHQVTLRWLVDSASHIALWSAPFPQRHDDVFAAGIAAHEAGGRFILQIECTPETQGPWLSLVNRWKRRAAVVEVFGV